MIVYKHALRNLINFGEHRQDRTGVGTRSLFGESMRFDLAHGFPLLGLRKIHFKSVIEELLWMLRGETNTNTLKATIWDEWADENGNLGPIYGKQWRDFGGVDQIAWLLISLFENPHSRRHIVSAWNPSEIDQMALPPCHMLFQCHVSNDKRLSLCLTQRSADIYLGVPFNIASYAALVHILCAITGYKPGHLIINFGDLHLYNNHIEQAQELLKRTSPPLPSLSIKPFGILESLTYEHFVLTGYNPHPRLDAPVAV